MIYVGIASIILLFALATRNSFVARRYKLRFAKAFLEEIKHAYPDSASLLTPDLGAQIAYTLVKNKNLASELNDLERQVANRPEIESKSYAHFDSAYSRETQELVTDLLKKKIEFAGKFFNCLPSKVKTQIDKKAELIDKTAADAKLSDEELKKDRKEEEERAKHLGLKTWRFSILMNIYDIAGRANRAAN